MCGALARLACLSLSSEVKVSQEFLITLVPILPCLTSSLPISLCVFFNTSSFETCFSLVAASQIVVAIIISFVSCALMINWKPYAKERDNRLAIVSQTAIFFTLFYALLTKVGIDKDDKYDRDMFGYLLIFVNVCVVLLVAATSLLTPWEVAMKKLARKHMHNAELKGLPSDTSTEALWNYFDRVVNSAVEEAAWMEIKKKDWIMGRRKVKKWLQKTGARGEWRCSTGDGPIDQVRMCVCMGGRNSALTYHHASRFAASCSVRN